MRRPNKTQKKSCVVKPIVKGPQGNQRDVDSRLHSPGKCMEVQHLGEVLYVLARDPLETNFEIVKKRM